MSTQTRSLILILFVTVFVVMLTILSLPGPASAAQSLDPSSNSCLTCHEDRYYLHDMGKAYCISEQADHCVNCHEGNATVMKMEESHMGMIAHPQQNDGEKCRECHPGEVEQRIAAYEAGGGIKDAIKAEPYTPSVPVNDEFPASAEANTFSQNLPVISVGLLLFGLWLFLVFSAPHKPS
jgi:hypothetical protein